MTSCPCCWPRPWTPRHRYRVFVVHLPQLAVAVLLILLFRCNSSPHAPVCTAHMFISCAQLVCMSTLHSGIVQMFAQVEAALPDLPTSQQTSCGEVVTLSPTLWRDARRDAHPPFRIHVNAGLHSMRAPGTHALAPSCIFLQARVLISRICQQQLAALRSLSESGSAGRSPRIRVAAGFVAAAARHGSTWTAV